MLGIDTQLKTAYEVEKMTPSQIAEEFGLDETAIKAKLMQVSSKYRKDCGTEDKTSEDPALNFSNDQLRSVNDIIYEAALGATLPNNSPDWKTRLKAATYIRDDKKGRKEVIRAVQQGPTVNILEINSHIQQARISAEQARQQLQAPSRPSSEVNAVDVQEVQEQVA